jgi:two-component system, NarL family, nitrate/nitrite response regulator NarL
MAIRCLIVDDSPRFAQAATELLMDEGVDVVGWAASGDEAVGLARELRPDLALVDIELGAESGLEVAGRVCAADDGALVPAVILISTHAREEFAELIALSPALGFLAKSDLSADAITALLSSA